MSPNPFDAILERLEKIEELLRVIEASMVEGSSMKPPPEPHKYITVKEAVELTGLSKSYFYKDTMHERANSNGLAPLPVRRLGGRIMFERNELLGWLDEQTKPVLTYEQRSEIMADRLAKAESRKIKK
jgi:predicted DNA-binding transcriptional regulator AlpA